MTPIYRELHRWKCVPHIWGETDCMVLLADWVLGITGKDPAGDFRGAYNDWMSCQRVTGFFRDPVAVGVSGFEGIAGLPRGNELRVGDVGIFDRLDDPRAGPLGGLWMGEAWATKGPSGATTLAPCVVSVRAFWSVGYEA